MGRISLSAVFSSGIKKGFTDDRGALFFDIKRVLSSKQPKYFLLENVKHLRGHDRRRTLRTGYTEYHIQC
ncbi:DNA cytosine methyltransferase [Candidatus Liberibacter asiaticus]|nr:DNA cytosine methyltransferase [Candidatus Liberibacter asiaticus]AWL14570.1 hypothetical protein DIC79_03475 [Candidatus Liberibacter asiaticus]MBA2917573.1 hypothetical protein [Candidatus Liberibacter asiaticus]MBE2996698.1 DNA cytosine methyltransferase [Candidatus Liberibacter asiaticus]QGA30537.1 hypothetical protein CD16_05665 [Candidatus Liberibacter asiaticus]QLK10792.1 hypothetical protein FGD64_05080 [Candidatus Liberibacter asiaticus]